MLLQGKQLSAYIGTAHVLRNVDMQIATGETVALVGRNGAGKTSLLRTIMGTLTLASGRLEFNGQDLGHRASYVRAGLGIGFAPEERRLIGKFTVHENIMVPAWACGMSNHQIEEQLELIYSVAPELPMLSDRLGGLLSGGQQKIVALGRALMAGTRLVLLDEPFQGLAPVLAQQYAESLQRLREKRPNLAILITESNPKLLRPMANRMLTIERGEINHEESIR